MADLTLSVGFNAANLQAAINSVVNRTYTLGAINTGRTQQALGRITGSASEFEKSMDAANARVLAFGASAGAIYIVKKAFETLITSTIDVETKLTEINSIFGLSSKQLSSFSSEIFSAANSVSVSFSDASKAALEFSRQGLGVEETLKRTRDSLILARVAGMDFTESASAITAALNSFSNELIKSADLVDRLTNADANFAVSAGDLAEAIKRVGSSAADSNVSLNETIALVTAAQQITSRGGAVIGNSFKTIFTRLGRSSVLADLEGLGVVTRDASGEVLPLVQVLKNLSDAYNSLSSSQKNYAAELVGGVYQINILKATLGDLGKSGSVFESALKTVENSAGSAERRIDQLNQALSAKLNITLNKTIELASAIGSKTISPIFKGVLDTANSGLGSITDKSVDGEGIGSKIADGMLGGIKGILQGPGAALFGFFATKLAGNFGSFLSSSISSFAGINTAAQQQAQIQKQIVTYLQSNPTLLQSIHLGTMSISQAHGVVLGQIRAQNALLSYQNQIAAQISSRVFNSGVRIAPAVVTPAAGFIPNFNSQMAGQMMENAGAKEHGYTAGRAYPTTVHDGNGNSFPTFVNSREKVETFTNSEGNKATMVTPPNGFGKGTMRAAGGFVPNFGTVYRGVNPKHGDTDRGRMSKGIINKLIGAIGPNYTDNEDIAKVFGSQVLSKKVNDKKLLRLGSYNEVAQLFELNQHLMTPGLAGRIKNSTGEEQQAAIEQAGGELRAILKKRKFSGIKSPLHPADAKYLSEEKGLGAGNLIIPFAGGFVPKGGITIQNKGKLGVGFAKDRGGLPYPADYKAGMYSLNSSAQTKLRGKEKEPMIYLSEVVKDPLNFNLKKLIGDAKRTKGDESTYAKAGFLLEKRIGGKNTSSNAPIDIKGVKEQISKEDRARFSIDSDGYEDLELKLQESTIKPANIISKYINAYLSGGFVPNFARILDFDGTLGTAPPGITHKDTYHGWSASKMIPTPLVDTVRKEQEASRKAGKPIEDIIVTARGRESIPFIAAWLKEQGLSVADIRATGDKERYPEGMTTPNKKVLEIKDSGMLKPGTVFSDDDNRNLRAAKRAAREEGVKGFRTNLVNYDNKGIGQMAGGLIPNFGMVSAQVSALKKSDARKMSGAISGENADPKRQKQHEQARKFEELSALAVGNKMISDYPVTSLTSIPTKNLKGAAGFGGGKNFPGYDSIYKLLTSNEDLAQILGVKINQPSYVPLSAKGGSNIKIAEIKRQMEKGGQVISELKKNGGLEDLDVGNSILAQASSPAKGIPELFYDKGSFGEAGYVSKIARASGGFVPNFYNPEEREKKLEERARLIDPKSPEGIASAKALENFRARQAVSEGLNDADQKFITDNEKGILRAYKIGALEYGSEFMMGKPGDPNSTYASRGGLLGGIADKLREIVGKKGGRTAVSDLARNRGVTALAGGFVPNFNALKDAVGREESGLRSRGINPSGKIYFDTHPSLPNGGIANEVDEPMGIAQGISRAMSEGRNPRTYGTSRGFIPNFAEDSSGAGFVTLASAILGSIAAMRQNTMAIREASDLERQNSMREAISTDSATGQIDQELSNQLSALNSNQLRALAADPTAFNAANPSLAVTGSGITSSMSQSQILALANAQAPTEAAERQRNIANIGGSILSSVPSGIAGVIDAGPAKAGMDAFANSASLAGSALMAVPGPIGIGLATAIVAFGALQGAYKAFFSLAEKAKEQAEVHKEISKDFESSGQSLLKAYQTYEEALYNSSISSGDVTSASDQIAIEMQKIPASLRADFSTRMKLAASQEERSRIFNDFNGKLAKTEAALNDLIKVQERMEGYFLGILGTKGFFTDTKKVSEVAKERKDFDRTAFSVTDSAKETGGQLGFDELIKSIKLTGNDVDALKGKLANLLPPEMANIIKDMLPSQAELLLMRIKEIELTSQTSKNIDEVTKKYDEAQRQRSKDVQQEINLLREKSTALKQLSGSLSTLGIELFAKIKSGKIASQTQSFSKLAGNEKRFTGEQSGGLMDARINQVQANSAASQNLIKSNADVFSSTIGEAINASGNTKDATAAGFAITQALSEVDLSSGTSEEKFTRVRDRAREVADKEGPTARVELDKLLSQNSAGILGKLEKNGADFQASLEINRQQFEEEKKTNQILARQEQNMKAFGGIANFLDKAKTKEDRSTFNKALRSAGSGNADRAGRGSLQLILAAQKDLGGSLSTEAGGALKNQSIKAREKQIVSEANKRIASVGRSRLPQDQKNALMGAYKETKSRAGEIARQQVDEAAKLENAPLKQLEKTDRLIAQNSDLINAVKGGLTIKQLPANFFQPSGPIVTQATNLNTASAAAKKDAEDKAEVERQKKDSAATVRTAGISVLRDEEFKQKLSNVDKRELSDKDKKELKRKIFEKALEDKIDVSNKTDEQKKLLTDAIKEAISNDTGFEVERLQVDLIRSLDELNVTVARLIANQREPTPSPPTTPYGGRNTANSNPPQGAARGGLLNGPSHSNGGIAMMHRSGKQIAEAEGGEWVVNKRDSKKSGALLSRINAGEEFSMAGRGMLIPKLGNGGQAYWTASGGLGYMTQDPGYAASLERKAAEQQTANLRELELRSVGREVLDQNRRNAGVLELQRVGKLQAPGAVWMPSKEEARRISSPYGMLQGPDHVEMASKAGYGDIMDYFRSRKIDPNSVDQHIYGIGQSKYSGSETYLKSMNKNLLRRNDEYGVVAAPVGTNEFLYEQGTAKKTGLNAYGDSTIFSFNEHAWNKPGAQEEASKQRQQFAAAAPTQPEPTQQEPTQPERPTVQGREFAARREAEKRREDFGRRMNDRREGTRIKELPQASPPQSGRASDIAMEEAQRAELEKSGIFTRGLMENDYQQMITNKVNETNNKLNTGSVSKSNTTREQAAASISAEWESNRKMMEGRQREASPSSVGVKNAQQDSGQIPKTQPKPRVNKTVISAMKEVGQDRKRAVMQTTAGQRKLPNTASEEARASMGSGYIANTAERLISETKAYEAKRKAPSSEGKQRSLQFGGELADRGKQIEMPNRQQNASVSKDSSAQQDEAAQSQAAANFQIDFLERSGAVQTAKLSLPNAETLDAFKEAMVAKMNQQGQKIETQGRGLSNLNGSIHPPARL